MNPQKETARMVNFRVFFADGTTVDITAPNPAIARSNAKDGKPGAVITKIKILRGEEV